MEQRQFEGGYYEVERGHAFYDSIRRDLNESKNIEFSLHGETGESYFLKNDTFLLHLLHYQNRNNSFPLKQ